MSVQDHLTVLREEFYLDSQNEIRRSKNGYHGRFKKGDLAKFHLTRSGYLSIQIPRTRSQVRRSQLVLILSGFTLGKNNQIDHINGNRTDDSLSNLRIVNTSINSKNRAKRKDNTSGYTGIIFHPNKNVWVGRITVKGKRMEKCSKDIEVVKTFIANCKKLDGEYTSRHGQ